MSHAYKTVAQLTKMLQSLDRWLTKAEEHAKQRGFEADAFAQCRLAVDMFPLARQVQSACDGAKFLAARLSGREAPKHADTEQTMAELHARIGSVLEYLGTFKQADFDGASERTVKLGFMPGKGQTGDDYLHEMNLPNTYFHLAMAYAILRHNGVALGKMDYLSSLTLKDV